MGRRVAQLHTVRIHTRVPVALPSRIDKELLRQIAAAAQAFTCIVVIHANHVRELHGATAARLRDLRAAGALLLSQTVLLKGINDSASTLAELFHSLVSNGVLPYYLHQLDRARGAWHFEVDSSQGMAIMNELRRALPGYALPRYVRERAGEAFKMPVDRAEEETGSHISCHCFAVTNKAVQHSASGV
jgi:KamA family protein